MILLEEPLDSLDPVDWLVYADWLQDRGEDDKRSRAIGKALRERGPDLWLCLIASDETLVCSAFSIKEVRALPSGLPRYKYCWGEDSGKMYEQQGLAPINPIEQSHFFYNAPQLVRQYWDKMAEIGRRAP